MGTAIYHVSPAKIPLVIARIVSLLDNHVLEVVLVLGSKDV